eukprot:2034348-Pleurochrysis_carterae.AAC.1
MYVRCRGSSSEQANGPRAPRPREGERGRARARGGARGRAIASDGGAQRRKGAQESAQTGRRVRRHNDKRGRTG